MTSSPRRRRTRYSRKLQLRRAAVILGGLAAFGLAIFGFIRLLPEYHDPAAARAELEKSIAAFRQSNVSAARAHAFEAVRANPDWGDAHAMLARTLLELDNGLAAEAELDLAEAHGYDPARTRHLHAQALLLQGDTERALQVVEQTAPQDRVYGLRIRGRILTATGDLAGARAAFGKAVDMAPKDPGVWTDIGRFRFAAGDIGGAIAASQRAVELGPGDVEALLLRGELVRTQYGLVAALPWFERALERDPWHHDALIEYAATLGDLGRTRAMLAATRRALEARPGSPQAYYLQAVLAARADRLDLARALMERTGDALVGLPGALLLGGSLDIEAGNYARAIEQLGQLVATQPKNITARKLLALAYLRSDAARDAISVLRPVVARSDADSYAKLLVARGFERIDERAAAARFLDWAAYPARGESPSFSADDSVAVADLAAAENPGDPDRIVPYLRALVDAGQVDRALARARQVARENPGAPGSHILLGDVLMIAGRPGAAATAYRAAADMAFDEPTMLRLVEANQASGNRQEAARVLALFLTQNPNNLVALRLAGHWQLAEGEYAAAIATLERLRERVGDRDVALNIELAQAYAALGDSEAAVDAGHAAYSVAPANPAAADAYGWALYLAGDIAGAEELLEKAAKTAPDHDGIRSHLNTVRSAG
ncbi:tetratricopeptide repeat protein [Stakelama tenebrarum]|uniref:Tetratricopeptide repeat protein n=1 Tax=Stakelama tenebrarum TaxID=2711215 RepID=A0A6G6YA65_9SPHN|nr:tetratricopeptide repeat protein [Sphingosinithalassobacter tenebrarum]QIG81466.1 tetratricopeptide repeat protein [Sphingosinithalassobacter tenebrarum]